MGQGKREWGDGDDVLWPLEMDGDCGVGWPAFEDVVGGEG